MYTYTDITTHISIVYCNEVYHYNIVVISVFLLVYVC